MDRPSEQEIVRGLRDGNRDAWMALCQQFGPQAWKHLARLLGGNADIVAEVYQETFLAVARAGRSLAPDTRLWGWLAAIAHNQAALYWRRKYRSQASSDGQAELADLASIADPLHALEQQETIAEVRLLLAQMSADYVTLLTAKYLDGLSIAEIVEQIGGTSESVRSRLARARRDFRQRYGQLNASTPSPLSSEKPTDGQP